MKKMFVTGMNMTSTKAYVEPKMKVIEVDVESLVASTGGGNVTGPGSEESDDDDDNLPEDDEVKFKRIFDIDW